MNSLVHRFLCALPAVVVTMMAGGLAQAQVAVSEDGKPVASIPITAPPGIAGMAPKLALSYAGGGVNGPVGHGWSIQGLSVITRCPQTRATDGRTVGVSFSAADKLCLDGQRLIQTDANGVPLVSQVNDAQAVSSGYLEYRTEKDSFARIRAYGIASGSDANSGPARFRVWTKAGLVYDYGAQGDPQSNALVMAKGLPVAMVWAVSRISDRSDAVASYIDFKYEQRDVAWGSSGTAGREWNLLEAKYGGNKIVFSYTDRTATSPQDAAETYHRGSKNVSLRLLQSVTGYVNAANSPVAVSTLKIGYDNGPVTKRSRVVSVQECAGTGDKCLPATKFAYAAGGTGAVAQASSFPLSTTKLIATDGSRGILVADFNGDGRTDILQWTDAANGTGNVMWRSNGDGNFTALANGSAQFNLPVQLFRADGCYYSMVADVNGDGLPDIIRIPSSVDKNAQACNVPLQTYYYINAGNGSFTESQLKAASVAIPLNRVASKRLNATRPCTAPKTCDRVLTIGWTTGESFHFVDVNGDGYLDVVLTRLPGQAVDVDLYGDPPEEGYAPTVPPCTGCTRVFIADAPGTGMFTEKTDSNIVNTSVYANPGNAGDLQSLRNVVDIDGDGLADLTVVGSPWRKTTYRSTGDGNFAEVQGVASCDFLFDFNGDGRADCLYPAPSSSQLLASDGTTSFKNVTNFNLTANDPGLSSYGYAAPGSNFGVAAFDFNGDGRQDLLRWHDDPTKNAVFLSNGDGTFTTSSSVFTGMALKHTSGSLDFIVGDFTGRGEAEFLRLSSNADVGGAPNILYTATNPQPPDLMLNATSGTGAQTTLSYRALSNSGSAGDERYISDRGTGFAAQYPTIDLTLPMYVVAESASDNGIGGQLTTTYVYRGLKADMLGRGILGFREVKQAGYAPNGSVTLTRTEYLQTFPYTGVAAKSEVVNAATTIGYKENTYCEFGATAGAVAAATPTAPCITGAKVRKPYLLKSVELAADPGGNPLPTVTTLSSYDGDGNLLTAATTTQATTNVAGTQTFQNTVTNTYQLPDTAGDNWVLGRLTRSQVQNTVPNALPSITTSAGSGAYATATQGVATGLCNLTVSSTMVDWNTNYAFTISGGFASGSAAYWYGTNNGAATTNGDPIGAITSPQTVTYSHSYVAGTYTRWAQVRNNVGMTLCNTPPLTVELLPQNKPHCTIQVSQGVVPAGQNFSFTVAADASVPSNAVGYWIGTYNGATVPPDPAGGGAGTYSFTNQPGWAGKFTRAMELRDLNTSAVLCTTNTSYVNLE